MSAAAARYVVIAGVGLLPLLRGCACGEQVPVAGAPQHLSAEQRLGRQVFLDAGCLACHRLDGSGNPGPGPDLSDIATRLPAQAIARTLINPTSPMPSFRDLPPAKFRALVAYLSALGRPGR